MFFKRRAGVRWYDRGNLFSADFSIGDFITDGTWRDLDISSIVGAGERLVLMSGRLADNAGNKTMTLRTKGNTFAKNVDIACTQVADRLYTHSFWVYTNVDGVIQYNIDIATWSEIGLTIRGYFK